MQILDGKIVSQSVKDTLKNKVDQLKQNGKRLPFLAAVIVGNNGASETYVASKAKNCDEIGFLNTTIRLDESISEAELIQVIERLNEDDHIDGILVQLPLPDHINNEKIINTIDPSKDVDGFHPMSTGKLVQGSPTFIPATPYGVMLMLEHYQIETKGKHAVVIGRSNIVGRPMSILLSQQNPYGNCTVTVCHSHTKNLKEICLQADIIVAALGKPGFLTADMVKENAVVIDVGITRVEDESNPKGYVLKGDVDFGDVKEIASAVTPVPGGVGPLDRKSTRLNSSH